MKSMPYCALVLELVHVFETKYTLPLTRIELTALVGVRVRFIVLNAAFNNISAISWRSVLLVEETREPGENHRPATSH
jgi:predicted component of type VI protein secretion system